MKILIVGNGYVGARCAQEWGEEVVHTDVRITSEKDMVRLLEEHEPEVVLNAAGTTGKPNVDWCETHQMQTIMGNTHLPIVMAYACAERNVYLLHIGSGCIFYGNSPDPEGWREEDFGNPTAVYSRAKYAADLVLSTLPNVGIARIRMPLDDRPSPRNIVDKLLSYPKIIDVKNSLTVIPEMVRVFRALLEQKAEGIFHVTNPGVIGHREILEMYAEIVGEVPKKEWITPEELVQQGLAKKIRSTNRLQSRNLAKFGIEMTEAKEAVRMALENYRNVMKKS